ncbi:MAG: hypothetical protein ACTSRE_11010 [Promethearchaeota archaeon]
MNRNKSPQLKYWAIFGFLIIITILSSQMNPRNNTSSIANEPDNPESSVDLTYYRWGINIGGNNIDYAEDVWADGHFSYVVGTLDVNTSIPKLILTRCSNTGWNSGAQDWNVTWTKGDPIQGNAVWGTSNATYIYTAGTSPTELILIKWDINGTEIWNSSWNLAGNYGKIHAIWGIDDKIYMSGTYTDDLLLVSWNEEGVQLWNKTWGGSGWEEGFDVWGVDNEIFTSGSTSSYGAGLNDSVIVKWDNDGNQIWNQTWGDSGKEYFTSIFGIDSYFYVCGNVWNENDTSAAVVLKFDFNGTYLWEEWWDGPEDEVACAIWANEYFVYLSASTNSWDPISDKMVVVKWSYAGIYVDSSWPWWGDDRQYVPEGIFGWDYNIYVCGWHNVSQDTPDDYIQFLYNFYSYHGPVPPWFEPIEPNPSLNGTYTLEWQNLPEVESYRIYRDIHPISDLTGRTPYEIVTNTSIIETNMDEGTYFYLITSILKGTESYTSNPRVVEVDLPAPPKKVPGYNVILVITLMGFTSIWVYNKKFRKN